MLPSDGPDHAHGWVRRANQFEVRRHLSWSTDYDGASHSSSRATRTAEGKTKKEIIRCLNRAVVREIHAASNSISAGRTRTVHRHPKINTSGLTGHKRIHLQSCGAATGPRPAGEIARDRVLRGKPARFAVIDRRAAAAAIASQVRTHPGGSDKARAGAVSFVGRVG